jgi:hypothetical protein
MEIPLGSGTERWSGASYPRPKSRVSGISGGPVGETSLLAKVSDELGHPTQAVEIKQRSSGDGRARS